MSEEANKSMIDSIGPLSEFMKKLKLDEIQAFIKELKELTLNYVRDMRTSDSPRCDFNSYPFMYKIIAEELFTYSQEHPTEKVRLFIGDVKSEFLGKNLLFNRVKELASKGIKFDIILATPPDNYYLAKWQELINKFPNDINIRMKTQYSNKLCHLILIGNAYRMEAPHDFYDGVVSDLVPLRPARFAFHDKQYAENVVLKYWETEATKDVVCLPVLVNN
jgi:hypothetical protein